MKKEGMGTLYLGHVNKMFSWLCLPRYAVQRTKIIVFEALSSLKTPLKTHV
jgi:hypothetical protein